MRFVITAALLAAAGLAAAGESAADRLQAQSPDTLVLRGFTLIDGRGGAPMAGAALVAERGRITWVGPTAQLRAPAGAAVQDLTGKFVTPGLINLHVHVGNVLGVTQDPKNFTRENVLRQLSTYAAYGVTSVVSMGSEQPVVFDIRAEQRASRPRVARLFTAYRGFTNPGGYPTNAPGMKGVPFEVATPAEVKSRVQELAAKKVDVVKMWVDDHLGKEKKIPLDIAKAVVSEARQARLKPVAHIFYLQDAKELVAAGLAGLVHAVRDQPVDAALIAEMKARGAWQAASTLARELSMFVYAKPAPFLDEAFFSRAIPADARQQLASESYRKSVAADPLFPRYPEFLDTAKKNLKRLADAGIRYGFGTDSGGSFSRLIGVSEHLELEMMVEAGLTPAQVIAAATRGGAEFLNAVDLGTIEKGKWADLVVLGANPLESIRNMRSIEAVYVAGNRVER